jgi:steroid delta-isomerase-like uncharacterized protein
LSVEEDNIGVIQRFNAAIEEMFRTGDASPLAELVTPDARIEVSGMPPNREGLLQALPAFQAAFSDFHLEMGEVFAHGDQVAYRSHWTATHTGELMGIPASGKKVSISETHIERLRDGKIVEHLGDWDQLGLLQQIGAVPAG